MTTTANTTSDGAAPPQEELVTLTIDGFEVSVPPGTLVIRAAELLGIAIPRFCDHPLLDPVGACRQCLVEIPDAGNGRPMPKPQASCTIPVAPGMVVKTQLSSPVADKAQHGIMEFLLINHPLDCPVCDKGGECPLQNQAMSNGRGETRFIDEKRTYVKPINISSQILLDRERCILCARCTRFSAEIAGDPMIEMVERGALQQVGIYEREPFTSYFSGNTVQICPVGALTSEMYRFRSRPFDLVSTPTVCDHCSSGCALRSDQRRGTVLRRLAGDDPEVNEEWNCDKGRWAFRSATLDDRLTHPLVRDEATGELVAASWPEAISLVAARLADARGKAGVLVGGRLPIEDAYAYGKFARVALGTNDVDFRARPHSAEEADFLAQHVAGRGLGVTFRDIESASSVLLAGLEPEEESPIVFLRLRKGMRKHGLRVTAIAPFQTPALTKVRGSLLMTPQGAEADALRSDEAAAALDGEAPVLLVGERLATAPGALAAAAELAARTGARLAWIPRRAGERGALDAGAAPHLLPGGRRVADAAARQHLGELWRTEVPAAAGRDTAGILDAARAGALDALVVGGVEPADLTDAVAALAALDAVPFLVSLEVRASDVTARADVVLPVAPVAEKSGTFVNWEGRPRPFGVVLHNSHAMSDLRVLDLIAREMDTPIWLPSDDAARTELDRLGADPSDSAGSSNDPGATSANGSASAGSASVGSTGSGAGSGDSAHGQLHLASWRMMLDRGRGQDGDPYLAGTARRPVVRLSPAAAAAAGLADNDLVSVSTAAGSLTYPLAVTDMPDDVVWVPGNSGVASVGQTLRAVAGAPVEVRRDESATASADDTADAVASVGESGGEAVAESGGEVAAEEAGGDA